VVWYLVKHMIRLSSVVRGLSQDVFMEWYLVKQRIRLRDVVLSYVQDVYVVLCLAKQSDNLPNLTANSACVHRHLSSS